MFIQMGHCFIGTVHKHKSTNLHGMNLLFVSCYATNGQFVSVMSQNMEMDKSQLLRSVLLQRVGRCTAGDGKGYTATRCLCRIYDAEA